MQNNDYLISTKTFDIKHFCNKFMSGYPGCSIKNICISEHNIYKCLKNRFNDAPIGDYVWFQVDGIFTKPYFFVKIIKKSSDEFVCEHYIYATDDMDDKHEFNYN